MDIDKGLEDKISGILSSPEDLKKITDIIGSLGLGKTPDIETEVKDKTPEDTSTKENSSSESQDMSELEKLFREGKNERIELLRALKPYLKGGKRDKIDTFLRLLNAAEILFSAKNFF